MVWKLVASLMGMSSVLATTHSHLGQGAKAEPQQALSGLEEAFLLHKWPGWLRLSLAIGFAGVSWLLLVAMTR